jgi:SAM-dependent methyltransferase
VDHGLWEYLHSDEMVRCYDEQMAGSPLAAADVAFCDTAFPVPGRLIDLGCGTGRLCVHFAAKGYDCLGVDLSRPMLAKAAENATAAGMHVEWRHANLIDLDALPAASFDYAACLFSTLGMVRGPVNREKVLANVVRVLKPGGRFVLHVHNRYFNGLGWRRLLREVWRGIHGRTNSGDITMPQADGGAPMTLHHFTHRETTSMLREAGFTRRETVAVGVDGAPVGWPRTIRAYGWLFLSERAE